MSDQLRDVMTRIAERAHPAPPDPTLWSRARSARRRGDLVTATAVGAAVFALAATVGVLVQPSPDRPDLVPHPAAGHPDHRPRNLGRRRPRARDGPRRRSRLRRDRQPDRRIRRHRRRRRLSPAQPARLRRSRLRRPRSASHRHGRTQPVPGRNPAGLRLACAAAHRNRSGAVGSFAAASASSTCCSGEVEDVPEDREPPGEFALCHQQSGHSVGSGALRDALVAERSLPRLRAGMGGYATRGSHGRALGAGAPGRLPPEGLRSRHLGLRHRHGSPVRRPRERSRPVGILAERHLGTDGWPRMVGDDGTIANVSVNNAVDVASPGGRVVDRRPSPWRASP